MTDRERAFQEFRKETGHKPFSPEFIDSLISTMRYSRNLSEAIYAWVRWRGWWNSSRFAVNHWERAKAKSLDQIDCAVDVTWFRQGKPVEWVEGAPENVRQAARNEAEKTKSKFSRGFAKVWATGRIEFEGHLIYLVDISPDPEVVDSRLKVAVNSNFRTDEAFLAWWKVAVNSNFEKFHSAWTSYIKELRTARAAYAEFCKQQPAAAETATGGDGNSNRPAPKPATKAEGIIIDVMALGNTSSGAVPEARGEPTTPDLTPIETAVRAVCVPDTEAVPQLFKLCRAKAPDCTPEEVAAWVERKILTKKGSRLTNPIGYLHTVVPKQFEPEALKHFREESRVTTASAARAQNIAFHREHRAEYSEEEWEDACRYFPELVEATKGAGG